MILNNEQKKFIDSKLQSLTTSKFRSGFKLKQQDKDYILAKGIDVIEEHAEKFIRERLFPRVILNDGKQTPMRGHPVFIAQHATATCCRGCLYKWHHIAKNRPLEDKKIKFIVALIMEWIKREYNK